MIRILATGMTGLVGTRIKEILPDLGFISLSRHNNVDITDYKAVEEYMVEFPDEYVLHMAAYADVDGCEKDKINGENGEVWRVNVSATKEIARLCSKYRKTLIYISTDFVFDGKKSEGEGYIEEDTPNPVNWYGETKYRGEEAVRNSGVMHAILRIAYPYGKSSAQKKDFVRLIAQRLKNGQEVRGVTDHIFVPTYIDDIAGGIHKVIVEHLTGTYHVVGDTPLTPYLAAKKIAQMVGVDTSVIGQVVRAEYFAGKAERPFNLYLKNDKMKNLGFSPRSFDQGLQEMSDVLGS
ncbi:MAG: SDR family oxidoreductase [Candidatus Levyibacteriota bacterium]